MSDTPEELPIEIKVNFTDDEYAALETMAEEAGISVNDLLIGELKKWVAHETTTTVDKPEPWEDLAPDQQAILQTHALSAGLTPQNYAEQRLGGQNLKRLREGTSILVDHPKKGLIVENI